MLFLFKVNNSNVLAMTPRLDFVSLMSENVIMFKIVLMEKMN